MVSSLGYNELRRNATKGTSMKTFTKEQEQKILEGFVDYKAKQGSKSIAWESSPSQGYWIDEQFFSKEAILRPFIDKLNKPRES